MQIYGLIGKSLTHSFSAAYFSEKFKQLNLKHNLYLNFELPDISKFPELIHTFPELKGINVTIPYKTEILSYLDHLSDEAIAIGAVNTVSFKGGKLTGHNTDWLGFKDSLPHQLKKDNQNALILGTGGASRAVQYAFKTLGISFKTVSSSNTGHLTYADLGSHISDANIIVNCTPLGTHPNINDYPNIPYELLKPHQYVYDLIYNPKETLFLARAKDQGCEVFNGYEMLAIQAEAAWRIWR